MAKAQLNVERDTIEKIITKFPAFSIHKDNYFVVGSRLGQKPSKYNSDAKFQFSFKQRLSNRPVALGAYAFLTYTQKSFWDIFQSSSPFAETNYNPGLSFLRPVFKDKQFLGAVTFSIEHESNGRDSINSRSWNFVSFGFLRAFSDRLSVGVRAWIPFSVSDNPDLTDYIGYVEGQLQWDVYKNRWFVDVLTRKGTDLNKGSFNTGISFRPTKTANQLLTLQWWQGYGESLIDYRSERGVLRVGLILKPTYYKFY